jgi:hypothetical protein
VRIIAFLATATLIATSSTAPAQTVSRTAPQQSIENRQARGQPDAVAKKRGTRCRIVKRGGQSKHVCTKAPVRR